jgi:hypothetical protein
MRKHLTLRRKEAEEDIKMRETCLEEEKNRRK